MPNGNGHQGNGKGRRELRLLVRERVHETSEKLQGSQVWSSIFRPGSIFRKGYSDSPRNRAYVVMNSVLYHLHPVKVKRHAVKISYTLCLGGLSFFLFILLTITGIFLMFFYRPTDVQAYTDVQSLATSVAFGQLVRHLPAPVGGRTGMVEIPEHLLKRSQAARQRAGGDGDGEAAPPATDDASSDTTSEGAEAPAASASAAPAAAPAAAAPAGGGRAA